MSLLSAHVELYEFTRGVRTLRCTPGDRNVIHGAFEYPAAAGFKRGRIAQSGSEARTELILDVPLSFPLLAWFRPFPPSERVQVRVHRVRKSDGTSRQIYRGVLSDIKERMHDAQIRCQSRLATMSATGLRRCWQVSCPHVLYGSQCGVLPENHLVDAVLSAAGGFVVESAVFASFPDGWFDGGYIRWSVGTDVEYRFVLTHVGDTLTLLTPTRLPTGASIIALPGCDHSMATCDFKFDNALRYGGQHTLPTDHPFDGHAVF